MTEADRFWTMPIMEQAWADDLAAMRAGKPYDKEGRFHYLSGLWFGIGRALFYVCKAMGPPRIPAIEMESESMGDCICQRDPVLSAAWWSWFDAARPWAEGAR